MKLYCIFGLVAGEEAPELIEAWDEYAVDSNPEGYQAELAGARGRAEYEAVREVIVTVSAKAIVAAFAVPVVAGEVAG